MNKEIKIPPLHGTELIKWFELQMGTTDDDKRKLLCTLLDKVKKSQKR